jgi:hypothetical protein
LRDAALMNRQHSGSGYGGGGTGGGGVRNQMPVASNFSFASVGLTPAQAAAIWSGLRVAIGEIQTGNQGVLRFEELYRNAYTLVLHKHGDMLYKGVDEMVVQRMEEVARQVRQASDAVSETLCGRRSAHHAASTCSIEIMEPRRRYETECRAAWYA